MRNSPEGLVWRPAALKLQCFLVVCIIQTQQRINSPRCWNSSMLFQVWYFTNDVACSLLLLNVSRVTSKAADLFSDRTEALRMDGWNCELTRTEFVRSRHLSALKIPAYAVTHRTRASDSFYESHTSWDRTALPPPPRHTHTHNTTPRLFCRIHCPGSIVRKIIRVTPVELGRFVTFWNTLLRLTYWL